MEKRLTCFLGRQSGFDWTHQIAVPATLLFPEANIKCSPLDRLPLLSCLKVIGEDARFVETPNGFVIKDHMVKRGQAIHTDPVEVAQWFLRAPYLWGGKSIDGLDCSGLVQLSILATNKSAPRDSDMQEDKLGNVIDPKAPRQKGDLVFWSGHIGMMVDATNIIHANAHHMMCVIEDAAGLVQRLLNKNDPITSVKRMD
jgi:hypothetical protein